VLTLPIKINSDEVYQRTGPIFFFIMQSNSMMTEHSSKACCLIFEIWFF